MNNAIPQIGDKYLVTCDNWFYAPDGHCYRAVFGTVKAILKDEETLGIKTNAKSSNWYLSIGNTIVAGCHIHYAVKADKCDFNARPTHEAVHEGKSYYHPTDRSRIYNADE